jgi:hypothetical protein
MVKPAIHFFSCLAITFLAASNVPAKEYKIGDNAEEDITAPARLVVIDAEATDALKEKEAQKVPVIYRYYARALDEVETAFHSTFVQTRSNFLDAIETRFNLRTFDPEQITSNDYQRFLTQFQKQNILFPVSPSLSRIWAKGESDQEFESALTAKLREAMKAYIRPDTGPKDIWVGSTIRLVSLAENETINPRLVQERGFNLPKTNFVSVLRAKTDLLDRFSTEERAVAKYLASFLKPNCTMEADLTRELRTQRTAEILAADRYAPGQLIVKRGQVIDQKIKAALDQLQEKSAVSQLQKLEAVVQPKPLENVNPWIVGAGLSAGLIVLMGIWKVAQRRAQMSLLPAPITRGMIDAPMADSNLSEASWRQRALIAEQQAAKAQAVVRAGLMSQLAHWMSDKLTQKLVTQRAQLLDSHQKAAIEMAELEARLEKVQAPLQERLQAYERRIADLEKELTVKGEENRELIKAKIQIIRKQLEIEREKNRLEFN